MVNVQGFVEKKNLKLCIDKKLQGKYYLFTVHKGVSLSKTKSVSLSKTKSVSLSITKSVSTVSVARNFRGFLQFYG